MPMDWLALAPSPLYGLTVRTALIYLLPYPYPLLHDSRLLPLACVTCDVHGPRPLWPTTSLQLLSTDFADSRLQDTREVHSHTLTHMLHIHKQDVQDMSYMRASV